MKHLPLQESENMLMHTPTTRSITAGLTLTICLSLFLGCAVSPVNHEMSDSNTRFFSGYAQNPGETIRIQVEHRSDGWTTLAETKSGKWPYPGYNGISAYSWHADVTIPFDYWDFTFITGDRGELVGAYYSRARVLDSYGRVLFTYNQKVSTEELLTENPGELWDEKGNPYHTINLWWTP